MGGLHITAITLFLFFQFDFGFETAVKCVIISHSFKENNFKYRTQIRLGNLTGSLQHEFNANYRWGATVPVEEPGEILTICSESPVSGRYLAIFSNPPQLMIGDIYIYAP